MAYFACGKAALTGTDKDTRVAIAKGLISPYFTDASGKETPRGVVQLDAIMGSDLGYGTGLTMADRLKSAMGYYDRAKALKEKERETSIRNAPAVDLYESPSGVIKTSKTFGFPIKTVGIILGIGIVGYLVISR